MAVHLAAVLRRLAVPVAALEVQIPHPALLVAVPVVRIRRLALPEEIPECQIRRLILLLERSDRHNNSLPYKGKTDSLDNPSI
ncbi:hypothetical protein NCCP133_12770 [Cytobacillus sp. NCCP-133]|nr:hypothetical protein NCCP133_12770 [Cytobacillus sp. NCCP-133]